MENGALQRAVDVEGWSGGMETFGVSPANGSRNGWDVSSLQIETEERFGISAMNPALKLGFSDSEVFT